jgi:hypothetical protein
MLPADPGRFVSTEAQEMTVSFILSPLPLLDGRIEHKTS